MSFLKALRSMFRSSSIEITGNWTGIYGYGENYPEDFKNKTVKFTAEIHSKGYNSFSGIINESEDGIPEPAEIFGTIQGQKIMFTKTYNSGYQIDENGTISKMPFGPMHVTYEGFYNDSLVSIRGQWKIESMYILEGGKRIEQISKGYWEMTKK